MNMNTTRLEHTVAIVDLTTKSWHLEHLSESVLHRYIGGEALSLYLYKQYQAQEPIVFSLGLLAGSSVVGTNLLSITARSPLTNRIESATLTTPSASYLSSTHIRSIVLLEAAEQHTIVGIERDTISFLPAKEIEGKRVKESISYLQAKGYDGVLAIGPAGENQSPYASIVTESYATERKGFGSLLGHKHVKALSIKQGEGGYPIEENPSFEKAHQQFLTRISRSPLLHMVEQKGMLALISQLHTRGALSIEAMTHTYDKRMYHYSPSEYYRKQNTIVFPDYMRGSSVSIDLLSLLALGPNVGNFDSQMAISWWKESCDLGLDPVSTGMVIASSMDHFPPPYEGVSSLIGLIAGANDVKVFHHCSIDTYPLAPFNPKGGWGNALLMGLYEDVPLFAELILQWLPSHSLRSKVEHVVLQENLLSASRSFGIDEYLFLTLAYEGEYPRLLRPIKWVLSRFPIFVSHLVDMTFLGKLFSPLCDTCDMSDEKLIDIGRRSIALKRQLNAPHYYPGVMPRRFSYIEEGDDPTQKILPYRELTKRYQFQRKLDEAHLKDFEDEK
jgi:hypothetical protein